MAVLIQAMKEKDGAIRWAAPRNEKPPSYWTGVADGLLYGLARQLVVNKSNECNVLVIIERQKLNTVMHLSLSA